jgi:hypothetical protein
MTGRTAASSPCDIHPDRPLEVPTAVQPVPSSPPPPLVAHIAVVSEDTTLPPLAETLLPDDAETMEMEIEIDTNSLPSSVHISVPDIAFLPISVPLFVPISTPVSVPEKESLTVPLQDSVPAESASTSPSETEAAASTSTSIPKKDGRKRKAAEVEESGDPGSSSSRQSPLTVLPPTRSSSRLAPPKVQEKEKIKEKAKEKEVKAKEKKGMEDEKVKEKEELEREIEQEKDRDNEGSELRTQTLEGEEDEPKTESAATSPSSSSSSKAKKVKRSEDALLKASKATDNTRSNVQNGRPVRSAKLSAAAALVASKGEW